MLLLYLAVTLGLLIASELYCARQRRRYPQQPTPNRPVGNYLRS